MDTLRFALALEGEGMDPNHAGIIAHELYALYAHSVLGGKYKAIDYGDFDELQAKARKVREEKQRRADSIRALNEEMRQEREAREAARPAEEARRAQEASAANAMSESLRETTAYLKVRTELNRETARLDFVLENGLPEKGFEDEVYRYPGWAHLGWFPTQREAIDAAIKYPKKDE
ncbi:ribonuclease D [Paraburkholderia sp. Clong3]